MSTAPQKLNNLASLVELLWKHHDVLFTDSSRARQDGSMYCPGCSDERRMELRVLHCPGPCMIRRRDLEIDDSVKEYVERLAPCLLSYRCVQCDATFTSVIYAGPEGIALAVFPTKYGGASTPHTPKPVAYYLDQAQRAASVGAYSAATAMYRAALEQLLFEQGLVGGMLKAKIDALEAKRKDGTAPDWAKGLDLGFLRVIKELGDGSIHTNGGDVSKQSALDHELVTRVSETFSYLLFLIYEAKEKKDAHLQKLQRGAEVLRK